MSEKMLRFFRSNIIDVLIVLLALVLINSAVISNNIRKAESKPVELEVTVVFRKVSSSNLPREGDTLYDADGNIFGVIGSVTVSPSEELVTDSNGKFQWLPAGGSDITVTARVNALRDGNNFSSGGEKLLIGTARTLHTKQFVWECRIKSISFADKEDK